MTHILLLIFLFLATPLHAEEQSLKSFEAANGKYGYKNSQDQIIIPAQFDFAYEFNSCGIAAVANSSGWRYINTKNETLITPFIFDNGPDYFAEGLARFIKDGKMGFFDECGKIVIAAEFDFVSAFENGKAQICQGCTKTNEGEHVKWSGGKWGTINKQGKIVSPLK